MSGVTTTYKSDYGAAEAVIVREKPDFFQVDYSLADRDAEKRLLPAARDAGAAVLTALPFGRSSVFSAVRGKSVPEWARDFDATTWPQFFLKFLLGHEAVTAVIPGTTNPAHLADNISAGRGRFPDAGQRQAMIEFFQAVTVSAGLRDRYSAAIASYYGIAIWPVAQPVFSLRIE